jgi:hypothetical protein
MQTHGESGATPELSRNGYSPIPLKLIPTRVKERYT